MVSALHYIHTSMDTNNDGFYSVLRTVTRPVLTDKSYPCHTLSSPGKCTMSSLDENVIRIIKLVNI